MSVGGFATRNTVVPQMGSILVFGDSISYECFGGNVTFLTGVYPTKPLRSWIELNYPGHSPHVYNAAIPGTTSQDGLDIIDDIMAGFPQPSVNIVMLNYGTNDAGHGLTDFQYATAMTALINKVIAAGKIPVVPKIPYSTTDPWHSAIPAKNTVIDTLYTTFGSALKQGPDFWTLIAGNLGTLAFDGVHFTQGGCDYILDVWMNNLAWAYP